PSQNFQTRSYYLRLLPGYCPQLCALRPAEARRGAGHDIRAPKSWLTQVASMSSHFKVVDVIYFDYIVVMPKIIVGRISRITPCANLDPITCARLRGEFNPVLIARSEPQDRLLAIFQVEVTTYLSGYLCLAPKNSALKNSHHLLFGRVEKSVLDKHALT